MDNRKTGSFLISVLFHAVIIGTIGGFSLSANLNERTITVDFNNIQIQRTIKNTVEKKVKKEPDAVNESKQVLKKEIVTSNDVIDSIEKINSEQTDIISSEKVADNVEGEKDTIHVPQTFTNSVIESNETLQKKYFSKQFQYISEKIGKCTIYPSLAEEMEITGIVLVQFTVNIDGSVSDIGINKSSGSDILDKDALKTIKRAAPFPVPPIQVKIRFPIQYSFVDKE